MKSPSKLHGAIWINLLLWGLVLFAKPMSKEQTWIEQRYNHCWYKVTNVKSGGRYKLDLYTLKCEERIYYQPIP